MRVYFSGAISGGRDNLPIYRHIVERLLQAGHEVPSAHVADPEVLSRESGIPAHEVYLRDVGWIEGCDAMVAEVSTPSLGVGYEVAYALNVGRPVLCLHKSGLFVSKMITGNPASRLTVATYQGLDELDTRLDSFIQSHTVKRDD
jgi:nucleoside 2-deoxyribosyltransferase